MVLGLVLLLIAVLKWSEGGFGELDYASTMRVVVPGVTAVVVGYLTVLAAFFTGVYGLRRR